MPRKLAQLFSVLLPLAGFAVVAGCDVATDPASDAAVVAIPADDGHLLGEGTIIPTAVRDSEVRTWQVSGLASAAAATVLGLDASGTPRARIQLRKLATGETVVTVSAPGGDDGPTGAHAQPLTAGEGRLVGQLAGDLGKGPGARRLLCRTVLGELSTPQSCAGPDSTR